MKDEHFDRLERALVEHGNQLGGNLVHLKRFLEAQRKAQETFLREQQETTNKMQRDSVIATRWAAGAATAAAAAAIAPFMEKLL